MSGGFYEIVVEKKMLIRQNIYIENLVLASYLHTAAECRESLETKNRSLQPGVRLSSTVGRKTLKSQ